MANKNKQVENYTEHQLFLSAEIGFLLSIASNYKNTIKKIIDSSNHPSDATLGYPLQLLISTSFELYIKTLLAIDCVIENKDKNINQETLKCLCNCLFKSYSHNLVNLFQYEGVMKVLGIVKIQNEPENAHVSHCEIHTSDKKFPTIFLKNSESARYASFSKKPDMGYFYIQESGTEEEKFKKILNKEKLLDSNDKFFELLETLEKYVRGKHQDAFKIIPK